MKMVPVSAIAHLLSLVSLLILSPLCAVGEKSCPIDYIYQFGASIADTGNQIRLDSSVSSNKLPYGVTFFGKPTGRYSDGLLIIDFIARNFQLPLLRPSLDTTNATFNHGANFAVSGSTALSRDFLASKGVLTPVTNTPLGSQLDWFKTFLNSTCPECRSTLGRSLVFVGEIGRNDFNYAIFQRKSIQDIKSQLVPHIVANIANTIREVIHLGVKRVAVPGSFATGCFPLAKTILATNDSTSYDKHGCLRSVNEFVVFQNKRLKRVLAALRTEYPDVAIVYVDYYSAFLELLRKSSALGFDKHSLQRACCGKGEPLNFSTVSPCGMSNVPYCSNPNNHIHWDGVHLTQEAYRRIAQTLLPDLLSGIGCAL